MEMIDDKHENIITVKAIDGELEIQSDGLPKFPGIHLMIPAYWCDNGINRSGYFGGWVIDGTECRRWDPEPGNQVTSYIKLYLNLPSDVDDNKVYMLISRFVNGVLENEVKYTGTWNRLTNR